MTSPGRKGPREQTSHQQSSKVGNTASFRKDFVAGVPLAQLVPRTLVRAPELVVASQPRSFAAERFRRLRASLTGRGGEAPQVVVVTSAAPSEGKSLVAINLALAMALEDERAKSLLVDADLHRPSVGKWLNPPPALGLSDVLSGRAPLEHAILRLKDLAMDVLPAGETPQDPSDLLVSHRLQQVIVSLRETYARIVIDTPPIVPLTDAAAVGRQSDGIILVVRAGVTPASAFKQAAELASAAAPVLGIVLNDHEPSLADQGDYREANYYTAYFSEDRGK